MTKIKKIKNIKFYDCILQNQICFLYCIHLIRFTYEISFNVLKYKVKLKVSIDISFKIIDIVLTI